MRVLKHKKSLNFGIVFLAIEISCLVKHEIRFITSGLIYYWQQDYILQVLDL